MSFTPREAHRRPPAPPPAPGTHCPPHPALPDCCVNKERKCASCPFLYQVEDPPWYTCPPKCPPYRAKLTPKAKFVHDLAYDNLMEYMDPKYEDLVMPTMAFWHYCDHIPYLDPRHSQAYRRSNVGVSGREVGPWPPLRQGECPPPRECEPCGPGPFANPELRRFFYADC